MFPKRGEDMVLCSIMFFWRLWLDQTLKWLRASGEGTVIESQSVESIETQ